jgi:hypothetical protein
VESSIGSEIKLFGDAIDHIAAVTDRLAFCMDRTVHLKLGGIGVRKAWVPRICFPVLRGMGKFSERETRSSQQESQHVSTSQSAFATQIEILMFSYEAI